MYPRIDSPCPLKSMQLPASGNFNCSACNREVHDLSHLNEAQRREFLASCTGEVCVSYKLPSGLKKAALAGVFVVANGLALNVAAQSSGETIPATNNAPAFMDEELVVTGGIKNPRTRALETTTDNNFSAPLKLIPVVEEGPGADNLGSSK